MINILIGASMVLSTIVVYLLAKWFYEKWPFPLLLPIVTATIVIIVLLLWTNTSYETYMIGAQWIHMFLGPAVVALAYPLYIHRKVLVRYSLPICVGSTAGAIVGLLTGIIFAMLLGFEEALVLSLAPKSVTTAVAMEVSQLLNGIPALAAVFVTIAGISGVILANPLYRLLQIHTPLGRGVGIGSASHAIGTAKIMEEGLFTGAISTVAMIVNAIVVSILLPIIWNFL